MSTRNRVFWWVLLHYGCVWVLKAWSMYLGMKDWETELGECGYVQCGTWATALKIHIHTTHKCAWVQHRVLQWIGGFRWLARDVGVPKTDV